jgi:hypothetical protein
MSWKIKIGKNPTYPYLQVDNWFTEQELVNVWKEIDFYTSRDVSTIEKAEDTVVAVDEKGVSKSNSFRLDNFYQNINIQRNLYYFDIFFKEMLGIFIVTVIL